MSISYDSNNVNGSDISRGSYAPQTSQPSGADIQMFEQEIEALLHRMEGDKNSSGGSAPQNNGLHAIEQAATALMQALESEKGSSGSSLGSLPTGSTTARSDDARPRAEGTSAPTQFATTPGTEAGPLSAPASSFQTKAATSAAGTSITSDGAGPNSIQITNTTDRPMTLGKFQNGQSTTDPSAQITLQRGQTGTIHYANGEAGFVAKADSSGKFQPNASRLEYEADADGKQKYPDVSYIDGRNASISLTDGASLNKGDNKSIAADAPAITITSDAAGNKTVAGYYDGSAATMQAGADYMQSQLGTNGAYLHPNDDQLAAGGNPMSSTQSDTLYASFGNT